MPEQESECRLLESTEADEHVLRNLYPFYLYDLSAMDQQVSQINPHGVFDAAPTRNHENATFFLHDWWEHDGVLFPFLFYQDDRPIGFALVATHPFCSEAVDYFMQDFFILRPYRRRHFGLQVATELFHRLGGRWELTVLKNNQAGVAFWDHVIRHCQGTGVETQTAPIRRWGIAPLGIRYRFYCR